MTADAEFFERLLHVYDVKSIASVVQEYGTENGGAVAALLALADSTEAQRDERYPASNWKPQ